MAHAIEAAVDAAGSWLEIEGVEGVAQGERRGRACILVLSSLQPAQLAGRIPHSFRGFSVVIKPAGSDFPS